MMTVYEEIVRISTVPVYCNARSNTDSPAFNAGSGRQQTCPVLQIVHIGSGAHRSQGEFFPWNKAAGA